jgi:hypothetical protein
MLLDHLDRVLELVAQPFDRIIEEAGPEFEESLSPEQVGLLEKLEIAHWERTGLLVVKAFQVGVEIGLTLGRHRPRSTRANPPADP